MLIILKWGGKTRICTLTPCTDLKKLYLCSPFSRKNTKKLSKTKYQSIKNKKTTIKR